MKTTDQPQIIINMTGFLPLKQQSTSLSDLKTKLIVIILLLYRPQLKTIINTNIPGRMSYVMIRDIIHVVINLEHIDYLKISLFLTVSELGSILTKFRISSHKLEIEKGRYMNIPAERIVCRLCKLHVENEIHFRLECPSLANTRREILDQF